MPQDSITVHLFRERDGALARDVLAEGDPAEGLEVVGFTADAHAFIREAARLMRFRFADGRYVQAWELEGVEALRGSCAGDFVLARDDESDEPKILLRRSDLAAAPLSFELPCGDDEKLLWAAVGNGPVVLGIFAAANPGRELRALDARGARVPLLGSIGYGSGAHCRL